MVIGKLLKMQGAVIKVDEQDASRNFGWIGFIKAIWQFLGRKNRIPYLFWTAILASVSLYTLGPAYFIGQIIDFLAHWHNGESLKHFYFLAAALGISYAVVAQIRLFTKRQLAGFQIEIVYNAKVKGFQRLMAFPLNWHARENTGNKMQRIQNGVVGLRSALQSFASNFFPTFIPFIATAAIFIHLDWRIALFTFTYVGIAVANEVFFYKRTKLANDRQNAANERSSGTTFESAGNVLTIKALGADEAMLASVTDRELAVREAALYSRFLSIAKWQWFQTINGLSYFAFVMLLALKYREGTLPIGLFVTYFTYFRSLIDGVSNGSELITNLTENISGVGRMMPIYWDNIPGDKGTEHFPVCWKQLRVMDAVFTYPGQERPSLNRINLNIKNGEKIGIAGGSGSGKSTLSKLLLGLHDADSGHIEIDGIPISKIRHEERVAHLSIVLQETELLNLSIRDNLTLCKDVPDSVIEQAIRVACLDNVINMLPEGIDTAIGEKGYRLSGGERQRLGIARAICAQTDIIILDEATSHLDSKTEAMIQRSLEHELGNKTLIIIAHRLSTLQNTNRIYVFKGGKIVEEGVFSDLIAGNTDFARMYQLQTGGEATVNYAAIATSSTDTI